jgi:hypothetical protein
VNVILEVAENLVYVRFVSTEPNAKVDGGILVKPGERFKQYTYEQLREMGSGKKTLENKPSGK